MHRFPTLPRPRRRTAALALGGVLVSAAAWSQTQPLLDYSKEVPDQPGTIWAPAATGNFQPANRPAERPIDMVVIHDIEGPAEFAVSWFQNPMSQVSSHYVMDGTGKRVWQQVKERDIGYHAGNRDTNGRSIGIEHEGFAYRPGFFNHDLYEASARLVRDITNRHQIPRDRTHIIGHFEVPHPTEPGKFGGRSAHTDPGPYWDWDYYMALVRNDGQLDSLAVPPLIHPGEKLQATATLINTGDDPWPVHKGERNDAVQALGPVFLGVGQDEPAPARVESPFYDRLTWLSPRYLAAPQSSVEVRPASPATFTFTLAGPRTLGEVEEQVRLVKVPVAPRHPVPFGPRFTLRTRVEPWDLPRDTASPGFEAPGWQPEEVRGQRVLRAKLGGDGSPAPAKWTVPLPISGEWDVYARSTGGKKLTRHANYEVATGAGSLGIVTVDQRKGGQWVSLGRFDFPGAKPLAVVTLGIAPGKRATVEANGLRFVGPFPASR